MESVKIFEVGLSQARLAHLRVSLGLEISEPGRGVSMLLRVAVGATLRAARTEQSRTLRDVARDARVSLGYLSEVERGQKEASSELLAAICTALGLTLSAVINDVGLHIKSTEVATLSVVDAA
jgi:DNA-binding XRE family transcriptional regulator